MTEYETGAVLDLDPSDYVAGAEEAADASELVADTSGDMSESLWDVEPAGIAAGGALAGIATGAQSVLDDTRDLREQLGLAAETMGITQDETEDMAQELSDATFPIEDAAGAIDSLAQQGIDNEDDMLAVADAADEIADATGTSAESVADNLGPAITSLGDDLEDMPELADAMTLAVRDSNLETEDLAGVIERSSEELNEMGLGAEDAAGLISEYADETGKSGTRAARDFQRAISDADGDMDELIETTGLSEDVLEEWGDELEANEGIAEDHAQVAEDNASTMDHLRARFDDARLAVADYVGPVEAIIPAAQAAGIAMIAMSTINFGALAPSFAAVTAAAAPLTAVILGVAAAVAAGYAIWERDIGGIQGRTEEAVDGIMQGLETLADGIEWAIGKADYILTEWSPGETLANIRDRVSEPIDDVREMIPGSLDEATELAEDVVREWHPAAIVWDKRDDIMEALPIPDEWKERGRDLVTGFADGIVESIPGAERAVESLTDAADEYLPSSDAEKGAFSRLTDAGAAVPETIGGAAVENVDALQSAMGEVTGAGGSRPSGGSGGSGTVHVDARIMPGAIKQIGDLSPGQEEEILRLLKDHMNSIERSIERKYQRGTSP